MTKPTRSLTDAVHSAARGTSAPIRSPGRTMGRAGKKGIVIYVEPEMARSLKRIAVDEDTTLQALGSEALEALIDQRR